jgi:hypothetical protein
MLRRRVQDACYAALKDMTRADKTARRQQNFAVGSILFLSAEFWRDWFPPGTWIERCLRLLLVVVSLIFLGASLGGETSP